MAASVSCRTRETTAAADGSATRPVLAVRDLSITFAGLRALDSVSFEVPTGGVTAVIGPNGAGKTTLFQLLAGLFVPEAGRIEVMGYDMLRNPVPALARLGIVFQQPTLDLELSVVGNLLFHAGLHGIPRAVARARIECELARLGLAERAHDKTAQLSGGNRRRVELARALLHEPRLLLMDEPTVGLDPLQVREIRQLIADLASPRDGQTQHTVILSTHILPEVEAICRRVILMSRGRKVVDAPLEELVRGGRTLDEIFVRETARDESPAEAASCRPSPVRCVPATRARWCWRGRWRSSRPG